MSLNSTHIQEPHLDTSIHAACVAAGWPQGGAGGGMVGFINNLRQFLWIPVAQDAYRWVGAHTHALETCFRGIP